MAEHDKLHNSLQLPKKSRLIVLESTQDRLELRTRTDIPWIKIVGMIGIVAAFVGMEIWGKPGVQTGAILFALILITAFSGLVLAECTYQRLRVADGELECQLRIWSAVIRNKRASLTEIQSLESGDVETESSGSFFATIKTSHWSTDFGLGSVTDPAAIDAVILELKRLKDRAARGSDAG